MSVAPLLLIKYLTYCAPVTSRDASAYSHLIGRAHCYPVDGPSGESKPTIIESFESSSSCTDVVEGYIGPILIAENGGCHRGSSCKATVTDLNGIAAMQTDGASFDSCGHKATSLLFVEATDNGPSVEDILHFQSVHKTDEIHIEDYHALYRLQ